MATDPRRDELLGRAKGYMQLHQLPLAVEQALLKIVPPRHPRPFEVLNQSTWLPPAPGDHPARQQHLKRTGELLRWLRLAESEARPCATAGPTAHASTAAPAGRSPSVTAPQLMTVDELLRMRAAAAAAPPGPVGPLAGAGAGQGDLTPAAAVAAPSWASQCPAADVAAVRQLLAVSAAADSPLFDVFSLLVDPFLCLAGVQAPMVATEAELPVDVVAVAAAYCFFEKGGMPKRLRIAEDALLSWMLDVSDSHRNVSTDGPFFNFYNSLGTLQRCFRYVRHLPAADVTAVFALFAAALSTNVHHPGLLTDHEVVQALHPLALRYNDVAPIAQNAASVAFALLTRGGGGASSLLHFLTESAPSYLTLVGQRHADSVAWSSRFHTFRRQLLLAMHAPSSAQLRLLAPSAAGSEPPGPQELCYLAAYHGWVDGPAAVRWKEMLRLQVLRQTAGAADGSVDGRVGGFVRLAEAGLRASNDALRKLPDVK